MSHALMALAHRFLQQRRLERKRWLHDCNIYVMSDYQNIFFSLAIWKGVAASNFKRKLALSCQFKCKAIANQMELWKLSAYIVVPLEDLQFDYTKGFPPGRHECWGGFLFLAWTRPALDVDAVQKEVISCTGKHASTATAISQPKVSII